MYAATLGEGAPPVVLLHGYGVSGSYMLPLPPALPGWFSVYVPDLPRQGRSEPGPGATGVGGLADALGACTEAAGLNRPPVVAN
jgi:2-hydroxy-6-oxonona-2,4-dienedioate hydrolase